MLDKVIDLADRFGVIGRIKGALLNQREKARNASIVRREMAAAFWRKNQQMPQEQSSSHDDSRKQLPKCGEENRDYWQYFSDRANALKDNLWTQVTWLLGLAGALIAFVADQEIISWSGDGMLLVKAWPALLVGLVGIALCLFGTVLIFDAGDHIKRNWWRQDYFSDTILKKALEREKEERGEKASDNQQSNKAKGNSLFRKFQNLPAFCQKLLGIVAGFMVLFAACVIAAVVQLTLCFFHPIVLLI